jgi:DNA polymerase III alpha subunit
VASLVQLAEADAMNESLGLARREALWALKALRDEPLELFAAAAQREARTIEEVREPAVSLRPMTSGGEVVEDYRHVGLTLRQHPASFMPRRICSVSGGKTDHFALGNKNNHQRCNQNYNDRPFMQRCSSMMRRFLQCFFRNRETGAITIAQAPNLVCGS